MVSLVAYAYGSGCAPRFATFGTQFSPEKASDVSADVTVVFAWCPSASVSIVGLCFEDFAP